MQNDSSKYYIVYSYITTLLLHVLGNAKQISNDVCLVVLFVFQSWVNQTLHKSVSVYFRLYI